MRTADPVKAGSSLTPRELEILELLAVGLTNREIATRLRLSPRTAETHVDHILSKLGTSTRTRAVMEARRLGLLGGALADDARPSDGPPNNLPLQLTSLVGREEDLAEIESLLEAHRLVTITGAGGVGKTRLALRVGTDLLGRFAHGTWLCDLAATSESAESQTVYRAVAKVLGISERPDRPLSQAIVSALKHNSTLLILDNCEHAVDAVAELADEILHSCPNVRVLATSRQTLGIIGEVVHRAPSLKFPDETEAFDTGAAMGYAAITLFMDRAKGFEERFTLTNENAPVVGEICRRLDGIPLAIELAASRVSVASVQTLAERLAKHFDVLGSSRRNVLPRHQTMRALIDWSYEHLCNAEQVLFRRLAIFAGGFTLELAGAVRSDDAVKEGEVFDLLASLIDKSLVQTEFQANAMRYRLLEPTRQYALEKLYQTGEHAALVCAHAVAMLELAERLDASYESTPPRTRAAIIEPELENWRAALTWALRERGDLLLGQRMAGSLEMIWSRYAEVEGRRWIQASLELVNSTTPTAVRARLDLAEANLSGALRYYKTALASAERALVAYSKLGDGLRLAYAQSYVGHALVSLGRFAEGEALVHLALRAARAMGARKLAGDLLFTLGHAQSLNGDILRAREFLVEAVAVYKASECDEKAAAVTWVLAETAFRNGEVWAALHLAREAAAVLRVSKRSVLSGVLCNVAAYLVALGRFREARTQARQALELSREMGMAADTAMVLQHLAAVGALRRGEEAPKSPNDQIRAAQLFGFVDARLAEIEFARQYTEQQEYDRVIAALTDALGKAQLEKFIAEGRSWDESRAVVVALEI